RLAARGRTILTAKAIRDTSDPESARRIIADELPAPLASALPPAQLELMRERIAQMPVSGASPGLMTHDYLGAAGVCILVILSTFPVVIPFIFIHDARLALRVSNAFAVLLLFLCGFLFGRHAGLQPLATGLVMVGVGVALVCIAIA